MPFKIACIVLVMASACYGSPKPKPGYGGGGYGNGGGGYGSGGGGYGGGYSGYDARYPAADTPVPAPPPSSGGYGYPSQGNGGGYDAYSSYDTYGGGYAVGYPALAAPTYGYQAARALAPVPVPASSDYGNSGGNSYYESYTSKSNKGGY